LPLLGGVILSAVASGQIVARTGRYRRLMLGALVVMAVGLAMLTQLRAETPLPILWAWMFVTGVGVGPMFAVFPLIVQNSVPVTQIGVASSNVSFFQQVGGTVGLAITGTVFGTSMARELPSALGSAGVPATIGQALASAGGLEALTGVGDGGTTFLAGLPVGVRTLVEPFALQIVEATHAAFSIATASTFAIGIGTSLLAAGLVLLFRDAPATVTELETETSEVDSREPSASAA
jgi:MFS family permease